jgi:hypothetical protein
VDEPFAFLVLPGKKMLEHPVVREFRYIDLKRSAFAQIGRCVPRARRLLCRDRVLGVKMHLPATVAVKPDSRYVRFSGQSASAAGGRLRGVIHEGGDIRSEEDDLRIKNLDRGKTAVLMKLPDEGENLIPVPYLLFDINKVWRKEF